MKATICGDGSSQTQMKGYGNHFNQNRVSSGSQYLGGNECVSPGQDRKILLTEDQIPKNGYCVPPDRPRPLQLFLNPATHEPVDPKILEASFPRILLKQEMCGERFLQIPEEVGDACFADSMRLVIFKIERID